LSHVLINNYLGELATLKKASGSHRASVEREAFKDLLKAEQEAGLIRRDSETTLSDIPPEAWDNRLGNRSALEWVLDQYKEKVVDLLLRLTTLSVLTVAVTRCMRDAPRQD
jgi:predicted helicase